MNDPAKSGRTLRSTANLAADVNDPPHRLVDLGTPGAKMPLACAPINGTIVLIMSTISGASPLSEALFSKNRRAVLGLLYGHPDRAFYLRQIVRMSGGGHGAIQRELKALSDAGIIQRTARDKQVYFQANAECPVFAELKALIVKTAGVADILKAALASLGKRRSASALSSVQV